LEDDAACPFGEALQHAGEAVSKELRGRLIR
jgi:hypothetical protein